jgi:hypothetical protein
MKRIGNSRCMTLLFGTCALLAMLIAYAKSVTTPQSSSMSCQSRVGRPVKTWSMWCSGS